MWLCHLLELEKAMNKTLGAGIGALMISSSAMAGVVINEGDIYSG